MALVGEAHIVVRAITNKVAGDIRNGFSGIEGTGKRAGESLGQAFSRGFNRTGNGNMFKGIPEGLKTMVPGAEAARASFQSLVRTGYTTGTALGAALGGVSALGAGLVALAASAAGAMGALAAIGGVAAGIAGGMIVARLALSGVGAAVAGLNKGSTGGSAGSAGTAGTAGTSNAAEVAVRNAEARASAAEVVQEAEESLALVIESNREDLIDANNAVREAQLSLNEALKAGREEIQQIGFDAEDAALAESKAALELGAAREALARVQDLPPNNRARLAAELAYQEAELNLRKAKDASADLNAEQDRLARVGVAGTKSVIDATNDLASAEASKSEEIRDGLRAEVAAQKALAKAKADALKAGQEKATTTGGTAGTAGSAGSGGTDPLAGLNDAQKKFALFIASLKPQFDELTRIASESFLPKLQTAIETLMGAPYQAVAIGIGIIGNAMGNAAISLADAIAEGENVKDLGTIFETSGYVIEALGKTAGSVWGALMSILAAADPLTRRFVDFLESKAAAFDNFLNVKQASGELTTFFNTAGDIAADFGTIFGNIFEGIGGLITANFGPGTGGQLMIDWLIEATESFATLGQDGGLKQFFLEAAENAIAVSQAVGALVGEIIKLGDSPAIKETFDVLKEGAPALGDIMQAAVDAGPALADLVVTIVEILSKLSDSGATTAFLDTLNTVANVINDALGSAAGAKILEVVGPILAVMSALGLVASGALFMGKVLIGSISAIFGPLGNFINFFKKGETGVSTFRVILDKIGPVLKSLGGFFTKLGGPIGQIVGFFGRLFSSGGFLANILTKILPLVARLAPVFGLLTGPIGWIITGISLLVSGLIWFFTQTEVGKAAWESFTRFLGEAWTNIVAFMTPVIEGFADVITNVFSFISDVVGIYIQAIVWVITTYLDIVVAIWTAVWNGIVAAVEFVWALIVGIVTIYINVITTVVTTVMAVVSTVWTAVWTFISDFVTAIWNGITGFISGAINAVSSTISAVVAVISAVWQNTWNAIGNFLRNTWNTISSVVNVAIVLVRSVIQSVLGTISGIWNSVWSGISSFFGGIWDGILSAVQRFGSFFQSAFSGISGFVTSAFNGVLSAVRTPINGIISLVNKAIGSLNGLSVSIPSWVPGVGGQTWGLNLPKIPQLAKGGVIGASSGGTLVNVAEAGRSERIEPLDPSGLSARDRAMISLLAPNSEPIQIIINPPAGADNAEIAAMVSREITFMMRKGATGT